MSIVSEFRDALTTEIEEQKKKGRARWDVRAGRLIEVRGPLFVYGFVLDDPTLTGVFDDTPVSVRTASSDASGHIIGISGSQIFVAIESDLGEYVPSAHILADPYKLLERLSERLETLQDASCIIADKCLRRRPFQYQRDESFVPAQSLQQEWNRLNEDQQEAIRDALGSEICYVWGPPGTGKTTTVGVAVASMIQCGRSVLLTSNTNVAVDRALMACLKPLEETEHHQEGRILRLGTPQIPEIGEDPNLDLDKITERKSEPLREHLSKLREQLTDAEARSEALKLLKNDLEKLKTSRSLIAKLEASCAELEASREDLGDKASTVAMKLRQEEDRLQQAKTMSGVARFVRGMRISRIEGSLSNLAGYRDQLMGKKSQAEKTLKESTSKLDTLRIEAGEIERKLERESILPDALDNEIDSMRAKIEDLRAQITELERQIEALRQEVVNNAVLVATTLARICTMSEVYGRQFDTVVCDEASMAAIPALYWACSRATRSVIIAGDFRQLAPIALSKDDKVKKWLRRDIYVAAGIDKEAEVEQTASYPLVMLRTQYRMQPRIRAIVSSVFYDGKLRDGITEKPIESYQPCPGAYVGVYDTSAIDPWCSWTNYYSRFNLYHAVLAVELCRKAIPYFTNIGVITPYKAQTRLIKALVGMEPVLKDKVTVSNVHRFQGNERDLMICDLVDSTGLPIGKLLKGRIDSEDIDGSAGARLINVACSRAKEKLAIIANLSFLRARLNKDWSLRRVLFDESAPLPTFAADQLVQGYADGAMGQARETVWPSGDKGDALSSFWAEDDFHSGFRRDLENSNRYIIIMSPFVTKNRLSTYIDLFRAKTEKGIDLELVTRPPQEQGMADQGEVREMLSYLERIGAKVLRRSLMHQKVIVIDGRIVWFGSLNALSHRNTQELMFRLESEDFAKQVMEECQLQPPGEADITLSPAIDPSKIPSRSCGNCGHSMKIVPRGRFGPFYKCEKCNSTANVNREDLKRALIPEAKVCPKCGREMEVRWGRKGVFLGCAGYKDTENQCRYTRSL